MVEYETGQTETGREPSYNSTAPNEPGDGPKKGKMNQSTTPSPSYTYMLINQLCKHL